jgi:hypothetical protein
MNGHYDSPLGPNYAVTHMTEQTFNTNMSYDFLVTHEVFQNKYLGYDFLMTHEVFQNKYLGYRNVKRPFGAQFRQTRTPNEQS